MPIRGYGTVMGWTQAFATGGKVQEWLPVSVRTKECVAYRKGSAPMRYTPPMYSITIRRGLSTWALLGQRSVSQCLPPKATSQGFQG